MKKFVFSAAALTLTGTAVANDDWAQLDQDIQALSASVAGLEDGGMQIGGRIRTLYQTSGDVQVGANDLGGFSVRNARLYASGTTAGDIGYRVEVDFGNGAGTAEVGLLDAYLDIPVGGEISARVGQFRAHVSRESLIDSGNLFFVERSAIGNQFSGRSQGFALSGDMGGFDIALTVQNGQDGTTDDLFYALRGSIDMMGGGTDLVEGAYGAGEEMEASAAVSYF
ncbi:MAG: porin, partial [Planctomycetota bacterium]|nr:porin [Planctomycetota bacterium]